MHKKEGIRYIEGIIEDVSKETPYSLKIIKEVWRTHKKHLESLMDNPDIYSITLPHLGILYFNTYRSKAIFKRSKNKDNLIQVKEKEERLLLKIKEHVDNSKKKGFITKFKYPQKRKGGIYKLYSNILRIVLGKVKLKTSYASDRKIIRTFEEYSNNKLTIEK